MERRLIEDLEIFSGLKANSFAGSDGDLGTGARIASNAGFAGLDSEDAETAQFDAVAVGEGFLHGFEDSVHGGFCLGTGKAGALDYPLD
jgi:hypothetical protein